MKTIKRILTIFAVILVILGLEYVVFAKEWQYKPSNIGPNNMNFGTNFAGFKNMDDYYCIEHGDGFSGWCNFSIATQNGKPIMWEYRSDDGDAFDRAIACVLYGGENYSRGYKNKSDPNGMQQALWAILWDMQGQRTGPFIGTNISNRNLSRNSLWEKAYNNGLGKAPEIYSNNYKASISTTELEMENQSGKLTVESLTGKVTNITIVWNDGEKYSFSGDSNGDDKKVQIWKNQNHTDKLSVDGIKKGTTIYLSNKKSSAIKSISINVKVPASGYCVRVYKWINSNARYQDLINSERIKGVDSAPITKEVKVNYKTGELTVKKRDFDTDKELNKAKFIIYTNNIKGQKNGFLGYDEKNKKVTYGKDIDNAYEFETGTGYCGLKNIEGEFTLKDILFGNYYVIEINPSEGYEKLEEFGWNINTENSILPKNKGMRLAVSGNWYNQWKNTVAGKALRMAGKELIEVKSNGNEYKKTWDKNYVKLNGDNNKIELLVRNKKADAKLNIKKVDAENNAQLDNFQFAIFRKNGGVGEGWLGYDENTKKVTYGKDWKDAKTFLTGESYCGNAKKSGEINLSELRYGCYYVFEIGTNGTPEYVFEKQPGYSLNAGDSLFKDNPGWQMIKDGKPVGRILCGAELYKKNYVDVKMQNGETYNFKGNSNSSDAGSNYIMLADCKGSFKLGSVTYNATKEATYTIKNEKYKPELGDIQIIKVDENYKDLKLAGAKFKIYCKDKGWLVKETEYKYSKDINSATEFVSDKDGKVVIEQVQLGTYYAYETEAPEGYDLTKQVGYENNNQKDPYSFSKDNKWVYLGEMKLESSDITAKYSVSNRKTVNKIKGKVWIDKEDTKEYTCDNIYKENTADQLFAESMDVYLYDGNTLIAKTQTDKNGNYEFTVKNVEKYDDNDINRYFNYWDCARYHVEFAYDNKQYIVVDPFVGNDKKINSKAMEEVMTQNENGDELKDEDLTGKDGKLPGRAVTYKGGANLKYDTILKNQYKDLKETPLTGYYNSKTHEIEDINLGIRDKNNPGYSITEELDYVRVEMNGYTYTYKQNGEPLKSPYVPSVQLQDSLSGPGFDATYTAKIYPTDIAYNVQNNINHDNDEGLDGLRVYVVYRIDVKNTENIPEDKNDDKYIERTLYVNSMKNTFDPNRYILSNDQAGNTNLVGNADFNKWETPIKDEDKEKFNNGKEGVISTYNGNAYSSGIKPQETKSAYIQFKVKQEALNRMLANNNSEDTDTVPTRATANAYHEYQRTDNVWDENNSPKSFIGVKGQNNYPSVNNAKEQYYTHKSENRTARSYNVYLKLSFENARTLAGTVFEDEKDNSRPSENVGNGKLDSNEKNRAKNVKVELLDKDKKTTQLYQVDKDNKNKVTVVNAETTTNSEGNYELKGVVPGKYYIRFTYGDGKQTMVDANGNKVSEKADIYSKDYKSTIITNEEIKKAIKDESYDQWYKQINDKIYSTALDITDLRDKLNGLIYNSDGTIVKQDANGKIIDKDENGNPFTNIVLIKADTPKFDIPIEDDNDNNPQEGINGETTNNEFKGFNLGLIKQIDPTVTTNKKITNVKLTNQVGTTLVSETPGVNANNVTALDALTNGSKTAKMEIDPENIYGSNIELTYEITITNETVEDYIDEEYRKFGTKSSDMQAKKVYVRVVEDDLDEKFNYTSLPTTATQTKTSSSETITSPKMIKLEPVTTEESDAIGNKTIKTYIEMTGWESLERGESTTTSYKVTALVANKDENDTKFSNDARIKSLSLDEETTLTSNAEKTVWLKDETVITIMPTTGENRDYTFMYVGAVALAVIASGVILIKKKVL